MFRFFGRVSDFIGKMVGHPLAFIVNAFIVAVWAGSGPYFKYSDGWQLIINTGTTILTYLLLFIIQNTQNRSDAATHAKLDEIIRSIKPADNTYVGIDHLTEKEIESLRSQLEKRLNNGRQR